MDTNLIAALIGAIAAVIAGAVPYFLNKVGKPKQLQKFVYIKVLHLKKKVKGRKPIYTRYVKRLEKEIEVFDEYLYFRFNIFKRTQKKFTCQDRSSGIVDMQILHPWQDELKFADKGAKFVEKILSQIPIKPSNVFFTETKYFNGFQSGNEDIAMGVEFDTEEARLVIDFSSLPNFNDIIMEKPKAYFISIDENEEMIGILEPSPGIYCIAKNNIKKGSVLRIDFEFDWEKL